MVNVTGIVVHTIISAKFFRTSLLILCDSLLCSEGMLIISTYISFRYLLLGEITLNKSSLIKSRLPEKVQYATPSPRNRILVMENISFLLPYILPHPDFPGETFVIFKFIRSPN